MSKPFAIIFFPNGLAAVFDAQGQQMPKYQGAGKHQEVIAALFADRFNWEELQVSGYPLEPHQFCDRLGRPMAESDNERYCQNCHEFTQHNCQDSTHERDGSNDWRECLVCHWTYTGISGEYSPPMEALAQ